MTTYEMVRTKAEAAHRAAGRIFVLSGGRPGACR